MTALGISQFMNEHSKWLRAQYRENTPYSFATSGTMLLTDRDWRAAVNATEFTDIRYYGGTAQLLNGATGEFLKLPMWDYMNKWRKIPEHVMRDFLGLWMMPMSELAMAAFNDNLPALVLAYRRQAES